MLQVYVVDVKSMYVMPLLLILLIVGLIWLSGLLNRGNTRLMSIHTIICLPGKNTPRYVQVCTRALWARYLLTVLLIELCC